MGQHRNPIPTVDCIIRRGRDIVLVRRHNPPMGWALPGGFVDYGERVEAAAIREAREETGLHVDLETLLYVYSAPDRDPRIHTITTVFVGTARGEPEGADDAAEARYFPLDALPAPIVFDHAAVIGDFKRFLETGRRPDPAA